MALLAFYGFSLITLTGQLNPLFCIGVYRIMPFSEPLLDLLHLIEKHPQLFRTELTFSSSYLTDPPPVTSSANLSTAPLSDLPRSDSSRLPPDVLRQRHRVYSTPLPSAFNFLAAIQLQTWLTHGFGEYSVQNEPVKNRHRLCLKNSPSYIGYVDAEEIERLEKWYTRIYSELNRCYKTHRF